jgi:uncharacterized protein (TIGR02246 family)
MAVQSPRQFDEVFLKAFNGGDGAAILALYEPGAAMVPEQGAVPALGHEAIGEAMAPLLGLNGSMDLRTREVIQSGDLALLISDWTFTATDPDGGPIEMTGRSTVVLRAQADGSWLGVVDDPWSSA